MALLLAGGCTGNINDAGESRGAEATCGPTLDPIRRLTVTEYVNTVAHLFPGVALPTIQPIPDARVDGFANQAAGQSVSNVGVRSYEALGRAIGEAAAEQLAAWAPCSEDSAACARTIATDLGFRAYRRPLTPDEVAALDALAAHVHGEYGMQEGVALVVQALLESPSFLFRPEFAGTEAQSGLTNAVDDYEMASRLAFFFLESMPDDALFAAAANGELTSAEGVEQHARRLMADPRARPVLTEFFAEWLGLYRLEHVSLDPVSFPEYDGQLRADLLASARLSLDKALWTDDSLDSLFTGTYAFVNDRLAPIFGVEPPGGDEFVLVELDPNERSGVLTHPALLASTSHGIAHSPIMRGVTLLRSILCAPAPSPPPGILDNLEGVEVPPDEVCTVRDRIAKTHTVGAACQGCHAAIDGAGFAFENYDALGRFRTEENGCAVDATGSFPGSFGNVNGAVELAARVAESGEVAECLTAHALRFALGRRETAQDSCDIEFVAQTLREGPKSLQDLLLQLLLSEPFRRRPAGE